MAGYGSYDAHDQDHLNKPLPPTLTSSPAPMETGVDNRQPTLPFRSDTVNSGGSGGSGRQPTLPYRSDTIDSGSHYSQRGNTLPAGASYPYRQDTYSSSVYTSQQPTTYGTPPPMPPMPPMPAGSINSEPPAYASQQNLGALQPAANVSPIQSQHSANPFETPFDDNAASSRQNLTAMGSVENGIPLQDRARKPSGSEDDIDHVYEAPKKKTKKQGVRFGELGMLGAYGGKRIPWIVYIFSVVQIGVFIGQLVDNASKTGSPIEIKPSFNYLIGPSPYVMINFGARFTPCMHNVEDITDATSVINWPCPNTTSTDASDNMCTLSELCGFGGVPEPKYNADASMSDKPEPNQWWRFIIPMFMHAGVIHIGFNLLLQLTMGREIEKAIGSIRFFMVYVSAGIFGFVLGGNYASSGSPSTGASGGLFGIIALNMLDLFYSWSDRVSPLKDLTFIMLDIVISFVLGLLPGVDNFSHIGGLFMGLMMGLSVLHSPNALRRRIGEDDAPYSTVNSAYTRDTPPGFFKNPVGFFKGRKPLWWAWWLIRAGALLLVFILFILLLNNFYVYHKTCSWCKYLSCLPVKNWCDSGLTFTSQNSTSAKRDLFEAAVGAVTHLPREFFA